MYTCTLWLIVCVPGAELRPVNEAQTHLDFLPLSLAEILRAAGCFVEATDTTTARQHEKLLEEQFLDHNLCRYTLVREAEAAAAWVFVASDPVDAEQARLSLSPCQHYHIVRVLTCVRCSSHPTLFEHPVRANARPFGIQSAWAT